MTKRKKYKWTNNDLQNTTQKTKDHVTQTPLTTDNQQFLPRTQNVLLPLSLVNMIKMKIVDSGVKLTIHYQL